MREDCMQPAADDAATGDGAVAAVAE